MGRRRRKEREVRKGRRGDSRGGGGKSTMIFSWKEGVAVHKLDMGGWRFGPPLSPTLNESGYMYFSSPQKGNHFQSPSQGAHTNCETVRMFGWGGYVSWYTLFLGLASWCVSRCGSRHRCIPLSPSIPENSRRKVFGQVSRKLRTVEFLKR